MSTSYNQLERWLHDWLFSTLENNESQRNDDLYLNIQTQHQSAHDSQFKTQQGNYHRYAGAALQCASLHSERHRAFRSGFWRFTQYVIFQHAVHLWTVTFYKKNVQKWYAHSRLLHIFLYRNVPSLTRPPSCSTMNYNLQNRFARGCASVSLFPWKHV